MRLLALALLVAAPAALAQTPCAGGTVTDRGLEFACDGVDLLARLTAQDMGQWSSPDCGYCLMDLWGWTDPETGREYALVGARRLAFVDVTDPAAPCPLGALRMTGGRDVKVFGHHAYAGDHGSDGVAVFDLHRLRGLSANPARLFSPDAVTAPSDAHNVVVADGAPLLATMGRCGSEGGYQFFDLSDPGQPQAAGCYPERVHDAQCLLYDGPDPDHAGRTVCFGFNADRVGILDVTDPGAAVPIADAVYPEAGFTHQGWLTEDRRHLLVGDEFDEADGTATRTIVFDVEDLDAPEYVGTWLHPTVSAIDHNLYVRGEHVYQANYTAGLRVLSLAGVATADLAEVAYFDTRPMPDAPENGFDGAWSVYPFFESGTVIVSDQSYGLFVLRVDPDRLAVASAAPPRAERLSLAAETPARGAAAVRLTAPAGTRVRLALYDLLGRELAVVFEGVATGAEQAFAVGAGLPAGVVVVRAEAGGAVATRRVTLVR